MVQFSFTAKFTLISSIIYSIVATTIECFVIYYHVNFVGNFKLDKRGKGISDADLIYHSIFIFSLAFQILLVVDALWRRNTIQTASLIAFNLLSLAYAGIQLFQHKILEDIGTDSSKWTPKDPDEFQDREEAKLHFLHRVRPLEYTVIGLVTAYSVVFSYLTYKLTIQFGWDNYKTYSADIRIRDAYIALNILQTLIKLDFFFILSYAVQLIPSRQIGYQESITETVLIFVIGISMLGVAWYAGRREQKYAMLSIIIILAVSTVYLIYRCIRVNMKRDPDNDPYLFTRRFLTFFLLTTLGLVIATISYATICFKNFWRGTYVITVFGVGEDDDGDEIPKENSGDVEDVIPPASSTKQSKRQSQQAINRLSRLEGKITID
ncbi:hypothetical protein G9A89_015979 [Geosiphon pyriformis]|nr:hypothetical protein G9A89_015979 [Geosiphon pyriformis]